MLDFSCLLATTQNVAWPHEWTALSATSTSRPLKKRLSAVRRLVLAAASNSKQVRLYAEARVLLSVLAQQSSHNVPKVLRLSPNQHAPRLHRCLASPRRQRLLRPCHRPRRRLQKRLRILQRRCLQCSRRQRSLPFQKLRKPPATRQLLPPTGATRGVLSRRNRRLLCVSQSSRNSNSALGLSIRSSSSKILVVASRLRQNKPVQCSRRGQHSLKLNSRARLRPHLYKDHRLRRGQRSNGLSRHSQCSRVQISPNHSRSHRLSADGHKAIRLSPAELVLSRCSAVLGQKS